MRVATPEDFQDGPIYSHYPLPSAIYDKRASLLHFCPTPILIVGCGFGGLVKALNDAGKDTWGIDVSHWAIERAITSRACYGNILQPLDQYWSTIVTEDLLPCLTDSEALTTAKNCAGAAGNVIHLVTEQGQADLNYHSCAQWMALTGQTTISLEGL